MALGVVDILGTRESRTSGGLGENIVAPVNHLTHAAVCSVPHGIIRTNNQLLEDRIVYVFCRPSQNGTVKLLKKQNKKKAAMQRSALIPNRTWLNKRSRAPGCPNHLVTTPAGDNFHTKVQLEFNSSDRTAPKKGQTG